MGTPATDQSKRKKSKGKKPKVQLGECAYSKCKNKFEPAREFQKYCNEPPGKCRMLAFWERKLGK